MIWGTGTPRREFLHVDDAADALVYLMTHYSDDEHINVGCGSDMTIMELASLVAEVVGFRGEHCHRSLEAGRHPTQAPRREQTDALGWQPKIDLRRGARDTYRWFLDNVAASSRARPSSQLMPEQAE